MCKYTDGICEDGAAILKDGVMIPITEILEKLNSIEDRDKYFLDQDGDGHWFVVPVSRKEEWDNWAALDSDDETAWTAPNFVEEVGGAPQSVIFERFKIK